MVLGDTLTHKNAGAAGGVGRVSDPAPDLHQMLSAGSLFRQAGREEHVGVLCFRQSGSLVAGGPLDGGDDLQQ